MSAPVNNNHNPDNQGSLPPISASSPAFTSAEAINEASQIILPQVSNTAERPLPAVGREPPSSEAAHQIQKAADQVLRLQEWLHNLTVLGNETEAKEGDEAEALQDKLNKIIDALATIGQHVQFPISLEEQGALGKLMDNLGHHAPSAENIEEAMRGVEFLFKTHHAKRLKPMLESLTTLLSKVACSIPRLCCLAQDTAAYRIIRKAAQEGESGLGGKIAFVLHDSLEKVCQQTYDIDVQIADALYFAGFYFDFPVQLEKNEIRQHLQRLADQLCPGQDHQSLTFNDLVCLLFQQFGRAQPDCEDISHFVSGLGMLGSRGQFTGFSQPKSEDTIDHLMERFVISSEESSEVDSDWCVELVSGISALAENNLLPRFKTQTHSWLGDIIRIVEAEDSEMTIRKMIVSLGKLSRHGRMPKLSQDATSHLVSLVQEDLIFTFNCEKIPDHYPDFLYELGSLVQAKVIPPEAIATYEIFYQKLLEKLMDRSKSTLADDVKVHFFYNLLQEILSKNPLKWAYATEAFQQIKKEETAKHFDNLMNLQKSILSFNRQRQLQGLPVMSQRKRPGSKIIRTETPDKKSKTWKS